MLQLALKQTLAYIGGAGGNTPDNNQGLAVARDRQSLYDP